MNEAKMLTRTQAALERAAAMFLPRGHFVDDASGAAIELEGPRLPGFHAGDVIDLLRS